MHAAVLLEKVTDCVPRLRHDTAMAYMFVLERPLVKTRRDTGAKPAIFLTTWPDVSRYVGRGSGIAFGS